MAFRRDWKFQHRDWWEVPQATRSAHRRTQKNPGTMPLTPGLLVNHFKRVSQDAPEKQTLSYTGLFHLIGNVCRFLSQGIMWTRPTGPSPSLVSWPCWDTISGIPKGGAREREPSP